MIHRNGKAASPFPPAPTAPNWPANDEYLDDASPYTNTVHSKTTYSIHSSPTQPMPPHANTDQPTLNPYQPHGFDFVLFLRAPDRYSPTTHCNPYSTTWQQQANTTPAPRHCHPGHPPNSDQQMSLTALTFAVTHAASVARNRSARANSDSNNAIG